MCLCVTGVGRRESKNRERESPLTVCHSRLHTSLRWGAEAESVGQMFANRPVDRHVPDLEWEEFYCPGKTVQLDLAANWTQPGCPFSALISRSEPRGEKFFAWQEPKNDKYNQGKTDERWVNPPSNAQGQIWKPQCSMCSVWRLLPWHYTKTVNLQLVPVWLFDTWRMTHPAKAGFPDQRTSALSYLIAPFLVSTCQVGVAKSSRYNRVALKISTPILGYWMSWWVDLSTLRFSFSLPFFLVYIISTCLIWWKKNTHILGRI